MNLVIGLGEVGQALMQVLDCPGRDIDDSGETGTILHIAYPWGPWFTLSTLAYEQEYEARAVVVHSTVPVGTCDPHGWVHSPVRGRHPNLVKALEVFPKWFGAVDPSKLVLAIEEWPYEVNIAADAATTEAGKLWELAQFGLQVRVTQAIYEWCAEHRLDPDRVYRQFAEDYNEGYADLGEPQFRRPILDYVPGPIGGHCVTEGARLLDHPLAELI